MGSPIVFFDIAGENDAELRGFYSKIFGWGSESNEQFSVDIVSPIDATIRKDPAEKRLYIGVEDITVTLTEIEEAGGSIDVPRFEVSGVVVLGLFKDPAGNPMGLVEMEGNKVVVP